MGVDQYTSTHLFDALPDGGRIELQRDVDDSAGVEQIRRHLQEIARAFKSGDFGTPAFVHMQAVPGAAVMSAKRDVITYTYRDLPRGGEVRIATTDPEAIQAIHEFVAFQRQDHRASGMEHREHPGGMNHDGHGGSVHHGATNAGGEHSMVATGQGDNAFAADMQVVHALLLDHDAITRTVTNLPNGVRTVTESRDPRIATYLKEHVASMNQRLEDGKVFNVASSTIPTLFENADRIHTEITQSPTGVIFTQTTDDPELVPVLQAHAAEVSDLAEEGMIAMMRSMMGNGGPMNHAGVAESGHSGTGAMHGSMGGTMHGPMGGMMNGGRR
jgi:hypothetical protein